MPEVNECYRARCSEREPERRRERSDLSTRSPSHLSESKGEPHVLRERSPEGEESDGWSEESTSSWGSYGPTPKPEDECCKLGRPRVLPRSGPSVYSTEDKWDEDHGGLTEH